MATFTYCEQLKHPSLAALTVILNWEFHSEIVCSKLLEIAKAFILTKYQKFIKKRDQFFFDNCIIENKYIILHLGCLKLAIFEWDF